MAAPRTSPVVKEEPVDGNGDAVGGGSLRPQYRSTFGVNIKGISNGTKSVDKTGAGALTVMGMSMPDDQHPAQPALGSRAGSS